MKTLPDTPKPLDLIEGTATALLPLHLEEMRCDGAALNTELYLDMGAGGKIWIPEVQWRACPAIAAAVEEIRARRAPAAKQPITQEGAAHGQDWTRA